MTAKKYKRLEQFTRLLLYAGGWYFGGWQMFAILLLLHIANMFHKMQIDKLYER